MDLAKTQFLSLITKGVTTALGIIQSIIVIRLLSPAEFGLVGLVMSIGGVIGVSQHLGIVDGAIREIAVRKSKDEIGKVFWVSHAVRQLVTIPLSALLLLLAGMIATTIYHRPEITTYIQIFATVLILQGLQDVLGATLTGMKRFGWLYTTQVVTAVINVAVFGLLTWQFGPTGFFWAIVITTAIMVGLLALAIRQELKGYLKWPTWIEIKSYGRGLMKIGAFMYASRIFFVVWQRLPLLLLGGVLAAEELGYLNVSLTFGSRLTIIAMALSEVNLAWMSSLYASERQEFRRVVTHNMHRVLVLMMMLTLVMVFFTPEILQYVIGAEYLPARQIILVMTFAFFLYALTDIGTSSVFVPADQPKLRAFAYGCMTLTSAILIGFLLRARPDPMAAALAVLAGSLLSWVIMIALAWWRFQIRLVTRQLALLVVALAASVIWLAFSPSLPWRIVLFGLMTGYLLWEAHRSHLLPTGWLKIVSKNPLPAAIDQDSAANAETFGDVPAGMPSQVSSFSHEPDQFRDEKGSWTLSKTRRNPQEGKFKIICFAGAEYDLAAWTNRQHVMSRVSEQYPVLYVEPRVWIVRYIARHLAKPGKILSFLKRLVWYEKVHRRLYVKSQWNLIPGSREIMAIAIFNHWLNRLQVLQTARWLGFARASRVIWIYDTEAAEYLSAFDQATVLYDCVDDHAAQAGLDRNPERVREEEAKIMKRADVVTVTSKQLLAMKKSDNPNTHLVLNAGDVELFSQKSSGVPLTIKRFEHPILGTVGALDSYKFDFGLIEQMAQRRPAWNFVIVGSPVVERGGEELKRLKRLDNVHIIGAISRKEVPAYVQAFDVCLIPYRANRYNQASFPLKFWEFMATGKPVVASGLPELLEYVPLISYARNADEFLRQCEMWLSDPAQGRWERTQLAQNHGWQQRAEKLLALL